MEEPKINNVLVRVRINGLNRIDNRGLLAAVEVRSLSTPEISSVVEGIGNQVTSLKDGDRAIVYNRLFDGTRNMRLSRSEMLCSGGIIVVLANGGF